MYNTVMKLFKNKSDQATKANALLGVMLGGLALVVATDDEFLQILAVAGVFLGFILWLGPFRKAKK